MLALFQVPEKFIRISFWFEIFHAHAQSVIGRFVHQRFIEKLHVLKFCIYSENFTRIQSIFHKAEPSIVSTESISGGVLSIVKANLKKEIQK